MVNWNSDGDSPRSSDMASRGRLGGLTTALRHDTRKQTEPARAAFMRRFYKDIPEDLPEEIRDAKADYAMRIHMGRIARASVKSRRAKARSGKARRRVGGR
jgi:hypothetical protein